MLLCNNIDLVTWHWHDIEPEGQQGYTTVPGQFPSVQNSLSSSLDSKLLSSVYFDVFFYNSKKIKKYNVLDVKEVT